ncbi:hypothetical protein Btru_007870 [Bulinus truncatus]|nr:hypothetical protein Btru_007870 [Bulinus truncatus]
MTVIFALWSMTRMRRSCCEYRLDGLLLDDVSSATSYFSGYEHVDLANQNDLLQKRTVESPRPQNYYHLEYYLLPDVDVMKTDVVTYGVACKIFMERHDAKVIKTWQEGDITWFAWAHSHTVTVNKELLLKLFNHTLVLRVWNTKDKCSSRARFDRPKAFRLPQPKPGEKPEDVGGVKAMVLKQLKHYTSQQPRKGNPIKGLPSQVSGLNLALSRLHHRPEDRPDKETLSANTKILMAVPAKDGQTGKAFDHLSQLAGADLPTPKATPDKRRKKSKTSNLDGDTTKNAKNHGKDDPEFKKLAEQANIMAENIKKNGICSIPLRLALLFGECKYITSRLDAPVAGIEDIFLGVSVNTPLLSDIQKEKLNPMMIRIDNATYLPDTPLSYTNLKEKCLPVYCKYKFFNQPEYVTAGKEHDKNIYWEETNVVLLGDVNTALLLEYLNGPGLEIEVHDRDRKPEAVSIQPKLFGDDLEDQKIANVGTVESRRTLYNPFQGRDKPWDPYGVARVNLSELLLGHKFLKLKVPISNCPIPDILGNAGERAGKLIGIAGAVDGPVETPMPTGHYVDHMSILNVKIELAHPIITTHSVLAKEYIPTSTKCPFNRIIFMLDYNNLDMLHNIQALVMGFNASALSLNSLPQHVIDAALSTYKLSVIQQNSFDLDIVTGFHVLDGERHIFILEGRRDGAILTLWEALPQPEDSDVTVLYNSNLSFSKRLYGPLDVDLFKVRLHEPLGLIVQQPLLYIRDMVYRPCYDALIKLHQITKLKKMTHVVRNDLFPTAEMIVTMSREFGVPFTQKDFEELQLTSEDNEHEEEVAEPSLHLPVPAKTREPMDNFNTDYMEKITSSKTAKNFILANITDVENKSTISHAQKEKNKKKYISVDTYPAYNYSSQYLNSSKLAKENLRQYLNEEFPNDRFAYNTEFLSGMLTPVNLEQEKKEKEETNQSLWRTENGWVYPGMKSLQESHAHPKMPHPSRLEDLMENWKENTLHANLFESPVDRGHYPWPRRQEDLELYRKPPTYFNDQDVLSMYIPWQQEVHDKKERKEKQLLDWKSRVVVDDTQNHFHRLLPQTEMTMKGFYSSNQTDRLQGLLKDPVRRKHLMFPARVDNIPALNVVNDPLLDTHARQQGHPLFPAVDENYERFVGYKPGDKINQLSYPSNYIPRHDYEHEKFKELKGYDFNVYHKPRSKFCTRPIYSLLPEERDNHLFRTVFLSPWGQPLPPVSQRYDTDESPQLQPSGTGVSDPQSHTAADIGSNGLERDYLVPVIPVAILEHWYIITIKLSNSKDICIYLFTVNVY